MNSLDPLPTPEDGDPPTDIGDTPPEAETASSSTAQEISKLKDRVRVPVRIAGWAFLGTALLVVFLLVLAWALISSKQYVVAPSVPQQVAGADSGPMFNVPLPKRKDPDPWNHPTCPIKFSDSRHNTGQERDTQLVADLNSLVSTNATIPELKIDQSTGITTVLAGDRVLLTVLHEDLPDYAAKLSSAAHKSLEYQVANQWRVSIDNFLLSRYIERTPGYLNKVALACFLLFLCAASFHRSASLFGKHFLDSPFWSMKALIWCMWVIAAANLIPGAEVVGTALGNSMAAPLLQFMLVSIAVSLGTHVGNFSIDRYFEALHKTQRFQSTERMELRLKTLRQAAKFLLRLGIYLVGALCLINLLGFHWQALLTGAGLMGVAITWIGQDLFRDFLAGLNILLEDQYGVGDMIETGTTLGIVEAFTLRSTKVRSADGSLSTIPNQEVKRVKNLSTGWSQVDFRVPVAPQMEAQRCLRILEEEVARIQVDFAPAIQEVPQILGVEELVREGIVLRALIKCLPGAQFDLRRELNRRIKVRFEEEGIEMMAPLRLAGPSS